MRGPVRASRDSHRSVTSSPAWPPGPRSVASRFAITQLGVQCRAVESSQSWKKWVVVASSALLNESATEETMGAIASSDKHYPARIIERRDLSEGCWSIRVDPGDRSSSRADNTQRRAWTTRISASNEPIESCCHLTRKVWNFLIELGPQGELTRHLDKLQLGDTACSARSDKRGDSGDRDRARRRFGPKVRRSVETATRNYNRVPLWASQPMRKRPSILQGAGWLEGSMFRKGLFHPGEGSIG